MKMDIVYDSSASSSSIGCFSADSSSDSDSVSSNMLEEEHHHDDASSSPSPPNDHMFELSDLMSQLPIKRGLSNYYNGKSDSFKNLISVKSLEDVPKNRLQRSSCLYRMKMKKKIKGRSVGLSDQSQKSKQEKYYYTTQIKDIKK